MTRWVFPSTFACLALQASLALAAGGEEAGDHGSGISLLLFQVLNLGILCFVLYRFAGPFLREYMQQRSQGIREQIETSQRALEMAQEELAELRRRLARAEDDARELMAQAEHAAEAEGQRSLERTSETAERLRGEARRIADHEVARARLALQAEAAELAKNLAGEMLREHLTADDDRRLVREFSESAGRTS